MMTSVHAHAGQRKCCPDRVAGEQRIVLRRTDKRNHTQFHRKLINQFLSFFFRQNATFKVTFNVNVNERVNASD